MPVFQLQVVGNVVIVEVPRTCSNLEGKDYEKLESRIQELLAHVPSPPALLFDLRSTEFFGTQLLETMLRLRRIVVDRGGKVAVAGLHPPTEEVFRLAHLDVVFPRFSNVDEALDALNTSTLPPAAQKGQD